VFTGLVREIGTVTDTNRNRRSGMASLSISAKLLLPAKGDSVSVNGACLTVTRLLDRGFVVEAMPETIARTTIGSLRAGARVNLEPAMKSGAALDGHLVSGHIDTTGKVITIRPDGGSRRVAIELAAGYRPYVAVKGSIAIDGVSLTVSALTDATFEVALIPHTLENTTLEALRAGDAVNIEFDTVARYLERLIAPRLSDGKGLPGRRSMWWR